MPSKQDRIHTPISFFQYRSFNLLVSLVLVIYLFKTIGKFSIFFCQSTFICTYTFNFFFYLLAYSFFLCLFVKKYWILDAISYIPPFFRLISRVLLRRQILKRQLSHQMFVRKLLSFSLLFLLSDLKYISNKCFQDKM